MSHACTALYRYLGGRGAVPEELARAYVRYDETAQGWNPRAESVWLAQCALRHPWQLPLADVWTRLRDPRSLLRFRLNAMIALMECRPGTIYALQLRRASRWGRCAGIAGVLFQYLTILPLSFIWASTLRTYYRVRHRRQAVAEAFHGKRVLITGASRGLGRELALQLVAQGAQVIGLARDVAQLEAVRAAAADVPGGGTLVVQVCDVADRSAMVRSCAQVLTAGPIDVAILNAGMKSDGPEAFAAAQIAQTLAVNVGGIAHAVEALLPGMLQRNAGQLVFISSLGRYYGIMGSQGYNASKAAVAILAESLRMDLYRARSAVGITLVQPGFIATGMLPKSLVARVLNVPVVAAARTILDAVARRKSACSFPWHMVGLTWVIMALPRRLAGFVLGKLRS